MVKDGKIIGLKESSNGRSCVSYHCCREVAILDELVQFKLSVANIDKKIEVAIQAVHIQDGTASGTIGFLRISFNWKRTICGKVCSNH